MKLIFTSAELSRNFSRLTKTYCNISFAVAWASAGTKIFEELIANSDCIRKAVIGTHFYQTHPDVLDAFVGSRKVRFILQPSGVFHPKIFVFWDTKHWEVLMGSANLTKGALSINSEAMVLITDADQVNTYLRDEIINLIQDYWDKARFVNKTDAISYRALHSVQQKRLRRLSGHYGKSKDIKSPMESVVRSMLWAKFFAAVQKDEFHSLKERCDLLELAHSAFRKVGQFQLMDIGLRKTIAGLPNAFNQYWGWFGSMRGAGYYHQAVNSNNTYLSDALDAIPLNGTVSREHYKSYVEEFVKAFPQGRDSIVTASRLLALKRPDYFVCIDSKNRKALCKDFGIKQTGMDYERYWQEIVEPIIDSVWWNEPRPTNPLALRVWDGRAALLDAIFYKPL